MDRPKAIFRSEDLGEWQKRYPKDILIGQAIDGFIQFREEYCIRLTPLDEVQGTTPARHVARMSDALQDYWSPLGEVATQWGIDHYRRELEAGTKEAQRLLDKLKPGMPGALLYFNKVPSIKYCPYTNLPFIGTPYSLPPQDRWSAIPHELGHYLFWNLGNSLGDIRKKHEEIKKGAADALKGTSEALQGELLSRLEEIFSDIVGVHLGGEGFVESLENFIRNYAGNQDELTRADDSHPPLFVRPLVEEHVLELLSGKRSRVKWDDVFAQICQTTAPKLYWQACSQDPQDTEKMSREDLLNILTASEPFEIETLPLPRFSQEEIIPPLRTLVEHLNTEVKNLLQTFAASSPMSKANFQQFFEQAAQDSKSRKKSLDEILLHPRILEGGTQHGPHRCWGHLRPHDLGIHNH